LTSYSEGKAAKNGVVIAFDDHAGHGLVRDADSGAEYFFHCTQIAGGSRTIAPSTAVSFEVAPGRPGQWEAVGLTPRS
jgi:cold shock CspA family protein